MKAHLGLPEALIEHLLIASGTLDGVEQVHMIRHGHLKQRAFDFDLVGYRAVEFVFGAADVSPVLLLTFRRSPPCALEL